MAGSELPTARPAAAALAVALVLGACGCAGERIRGVEDSMEPTVHSGEILDFDSGAYDSSEPRVGDLVALLAPEGYELPFCGVPRGTWSPCGKPNSELTDVSLLKRVMALPGDTVAITAAGRLIRNGEPAYEFRVIPCRPRDRCALPDAVRIPLGHYFVLGDNRPVSSDSRDWGPVPLEAIEGRVTPLR